jgi:hypothetical protein
MNKSFDQKMFPISWHQKNQKEGKNEKSILAEKDYMRLKERRNK